MIKGLKQKIKKLSITAVLLNAALLNSACSINAPSPEPIIDTNNSDETAYANLTEEERLENLFALASQALPTEEAIISKSGICQVTFSKSLFSNKPLVNLDFRDAIGNRKQKISGLEQIGSTDFWGARTGETSYAVFGKSEAGEPLCLRGNEHQIRIATAVFGDQIYVLNNP